MKSARAKKYLGQRFLTDLGAAQRITDSVADYLGTPILEVGPGMDVLTWPLLETRHDLRVIDIDHESIEYPYQYFPQLSQEGRIIGGDPLRLLAEELIPRRADTLFVVVGDYPYNISSQISPRILELHERISAVANILQHEIVQRLCASPGGHDYGTLSVLLQYWYDCGYLFRVSKRDFNPPPRMDGGVMITRRNGRTSLPCDETSFKRVVRTTFGQQRRTLRNTLQSLFGKEFPHVNHDTFTLRTECLSMEDLIGLTLICRALPQKNTTIL